MFRIFLIYCSILLTISAVGQVRDSLFIQLEAQLKVGENRAIRDIATLIKQPKSSERAIRLLQEYTLLTPQEWDWSNPAAQPAFLQFYYDHFNQWKFSPLLDVFYLTPVEEHAVKHVVRAGRKTGETEVQLRFLVRDFQSALQTQDQFGVAALLHEMTNLQSVEANRFLLSLFQNLEFKDKKKPYYDLLFNALVQAPFPENVQVILDHLAEGQLSQRRAIALLSQITNVQIIENDSTELAVRYRHLLDSLGSMSAIRQYGYDQLFEFQPTFFEFPVDYYGLVLSQAEAFPWIIKNAIRDVLQTEHPRALFYVAAQLYQFRQRPNWIYSIEEFVEILERSTGLKVAIENSQQELRFSTDLNRDPVALQNYVTYWAAHYEDYEWDVLRRRFVNKNQAVAQTEVYEGLFRRLNSSNDSVALESYLALSQGDPIEVLALAKKYKDLLRNYNKVLPSIKTNYLEQLVQLTHFCQQNGYSHQAPKSIASLLELLQTSLPPEQRYQLENELLQQLQIKNVTAVEYETIIGVNFRPFCYSTARILDRFYAKNWSAIINDREQLRLYLKKSYLFQNLGTIGICNKYFNKFDNQNDDLRQQLTEMYKVETDIDVLRGIKRLLASENPTERLRNFFLDPLTVDQNELDELPDLQIAQQEMIIKALMSVETEGAEKRILDYVEQQLNLNLVPQLMQLLTLEIQPEQVAKLLNRWFRIKKSSADWLLLWQTQGDTYQQWSRIFFNQQLTFIKESLTLSIKDINNTTQSEHFTNEYKDLILSSLSKLKSVATIRRLKTPEKLKLATDLHYFEPFSFSYKELDDIARLFEIDNPAQLMNFMERKAADFTIEEEGSFYNSLFRTDWFITYVNDDGLSEEQSLHIESTLSSYLNESDLISEFEEQATIRNIMALNNRGTSLAERLEKSILLDADESSKAEVQESIIARVSYEQIPIVMEYYDRLSESYRLNFLNQDFGLPIFDLEDVQTQQEIIKRHRKQTPEEFYCSYLKDFRVDFLQRNGQLDYQKIYNILQFDIVTPFAGGGGNTRDWYTYGIIKLLEFEFDTRLDYHPKLNENQRFYSYSAIKRATDWMEFLVKNNLARPNMAGAPSFTKRD